MFLLHLHDIWANVKQEVPEALQWIQELIRPRKFDNGVHVSEFPPSSRPNTNLQNLAKYANVLGVSWESWEGDLWILHI